MNPHCRIGRVRPKAGLALHPSTRKGQDLAADMRRYANEIASIAPESLAGVVVIGWYMNGGWNRGVAIREEGFIGKTLLPAFVAEILRRQVSADVAEDVLRGAPIA